MKVFYRPEQNAVNAGSYSPSANKPQQVVADWLKHGIITPDDIESFEPVTREDLYLAHDAAHVDGVLNLTKRNGFGNTNAEVAESLRYTSGSLLAAAEHAVLHRVNTCSPTSGFHHAGYTQGAGFCTFNGLLVTALKLKRAGIVNRIGILDCDMHYGDGTQNIIDTLGIDWIVHATQGADLTDRSQIGAGTIMYGWLSKHIGRMDKCDLILYQAGADPHVDDPLGGLFETHQLANRDKYVRDECRHLGIPVCWNLAGGYQRDKAGTIEPVLEIHRNTARIFAKEKP